MFKKLASPLISAVLGLFVTSAIAQPVAKPQVKEWSKRTKNVRKVKNHRATTRDGKPVLVDESGRRYLLTNDGKRFVVDQNGNKIQVNNLGKKILLPSQKEIKLRLGPGPVA